MLFIHQADTLAEFHFFLLRMRSPLRTSWTNLRVVGHALFICMKNLWISWKAANIKLSEGVSVFTG